ncbi:hypothetical protein FGO68_gene17425 [Halteria grandinella]|uniref:Uncharacterized protein n=1 Tax=Halteria grandinella TaxID=5974 RepID=A0A8J8T389_HALGN|nr:hypothetical protein FGO68_gene17425 [Halteria grandinella]
MNDGQPLSDYQNWPRIMVEVQGRSIPVNSSDHGGSGSVAYTLQQQYLANRACLINAQQFKDGILLKIKQQLNAGDEYSGLKAVNEIRDPLDGFEVSWEDEDLFEQQIYSVISSSTYYKMGISMDPKTIALHQNEVFMKHQLSIANFLDQNNLPAPSQLIAENTDEIIQSLSRQNRLWAQIMKNQEGTNQGQEQKEIYQNEKHYCELNDKQLEGQQFQCCDALMKSKLLIWPCLEDYSALAHQSMEINQNYYKQKAQGQIDQSYVRDFINQIQRGTQIRDQSQTCGITNQPLLQNVDISHQAKCIEIRQSLDQSELIPNVDDVKHNFQDHSINELRDYQMCHQQIGDSPTFHKRNQDFCLENESDHFHDQHPELDQFDDLEEHTSPKTIMQLTHQSKQIIRRYLPNDYIIKLYAHLINNQHQVQIEKLRRCQTKKALISSTLKMADNHTIPHQYSNIPIRI